MDARLSKSTALMLAVNDLCIHLGQRSSILHRAANYWLIKLLFSGYYDSVAHQRIYYMLYYIYVIFFKTRCFDVCYNFII